MEMAQSRLGIDPPRVQLVQDASAAVFIRRRVCAVLGARVEVARDGNTLAVLEPRLNRYARSSQPVATPAVDTSLRGDFYLSLTGIGGGRISLDVFWFPFIWLIWLGGLLAAAAGMFSLIVKKPARVKAEVGEASTHA